MIKYIKGDATYPIKDNAIIAHVVNDIGKWGSGFVLAISKKWYTPEEQYRRTIKYILGDIQNIQVESNIVVVNLIAQHGIYNKNNKLPIKYDALRNCLKKLNEYAIKMKMSIHMPKIGSGLARGNWEIIEKIINEEIKTECYVYLK